MRYRGSAGDRKATLNSQMEEPPSYNHIRGSTPKNDFHLCQNISMHRICC